MSIKRDMFEAGNFVVRKKKNRRDHKVAVFLKKNSDHAYRVNEIVKASKMKYHSTRSILRCLMKDGLVIHKTPYFAWKVNKKSRKKSAKRKSKKR